MLFYIENKKYIQWVHHLQNRIITEVRKTDQY